MYVFVHIKAVTYVIFPNKQNFLPKLIRQKYKRKCQTRIYCQLNIALDHACWTMQKEAFVTMWKENYQNTRIVNEQMVS